MLLAQAITRVWALCHCLLSSGDRDGDGRADPADPATWAWARACAEACAESSSSSLEEEEESDSAAAAAHCSVEVT